MLLLLIVIRINRKEFEINYQLHEISLLISSLMFVCDFGNRHNTRNIPHIKMWLGLRHANECCLWIIISCQQRASRVSDSQPMPVVAGTWFGTVG